LWLVKASKGPQKVELPKGRPVSIAEVVLAVSAVQKHDPREPSLAAGATYQVGIRTIVRIEKLIQSIGRETPENLLVWIPTHETFLEVAFDGFDDFLPATVADSDVEQNSIAVSGCRLRVLKGLESRGWKQFYFADRANSNPESFGQPAFNPFSHGALDDLHDSTDILGVAAQVLRREPPKRDHWDLQLSTPGQDFLCLCRCKSIPFELGDTCLLSVAAVTILDKPEMTRHGSLLHLGKKSPLVEPIEKSLQGCSL